jgi:hypothetical protein
MQIRQNRVTQIVRAKRIHKSLGTKVAARYLALRGWSIEAARYILLGV